MRFVSSLTTVTLYALWLLSLGEALNPIEIKGSKFFDSVTKEQFFIKGVAYQPQGLGSNEMDPLAQPSVCQRDVQLMQQLGLNVIRVDATQNHDQCMKMFENAGIYLILDLANPTNSINRVSPTYTTTIYDSYIATVDAFAGYTNTLGFFAGNEVTSNSSTTSASAFVRAALRDVKAYIKQNKSRYIPVGYSANDDPDVRDNLLSYFNCGNDESTRADFYGINLYEWCGNSSFQASGYADRTAEIQNYSIPIFLSEYGCNLVSPRPFTEVQTIYGPEMTPYWSGGIAYEWTQEANQYGLVQIDSSGNANILQDYTNLKQQLASVNPQGVSEGSYNPTSQPASCPSTSSSWNCSINLPPTPTNATCDCMMKAISCTVSNQVFASKDTIGQQLGYACGLTSCADITADGSSGTYGAYSYCVHSQQLAYAYSAYYLSQGKNSQACSFGGNAQTQTASGDLSSCPQLAAQPGQKAGSSSKKSGAAVVGIHWGRVVLALTACALVASAM